MVKDNKKIQVSQDTLYQYIIEHGLTVLRLAEYMGVNNSTITNYFRHNIGFDGKPYSFTGSSIERLNDTLVKIAEDIRGCLLTFGSDRTYTNQRGKTYDPALVPLIKNGPGRYFNLNALCERVLGWNKSKKHNILETVTGRAYGCISKDDVDRINAEIRAVADTLAGWEVVAGGDGIKSEE